MTDVNLDIDIIRDIIHMRATNIINDEETLQLLNDIRADVFLEDNELTEIPPRIQRLITMTEQMIDVGMDLIDQKL